MFTVFAFKIKVSIILKMIKWTYHLTRQNWLVFELGTLLPIQLVLISKFAFGPEKLSGLSRNGPQLARLLGPVSPRIHMRNFSTGMSSGAKFEKQIKQTLRNTKIITFAPIKALAMQLLKLYHALQLNGCLWCGKYSRQSKTMPFGPPHFIPLSSW